MHTKDRLARRLAVIALIAAAGGYLYGSAQADSISEPDAYAAATRLAALQAQVDQLSDANAEFAVQIDGLVASADDQAAAIDDLDSASTSNCLAFSDRHYVRETVDGSSRKYRMPLVVWRTDVKACRPDSGPWKSRRIAR